MNLGFDLDKIFIDYPPFIPSQVIDSLYRNHSSNNTLSYRIPSKLEQQIRIISHTPVFRPFIKKNIEFIKNLERKHHRYLISSRFGFLKQITTSLMKKHDFSSFFDELYFNFDNKQPHIFKNEVIQKLKIKRYVDDDLYLLQNLSKKNPTIRFYWFNNKKNAALGKNLFSITDLHYVLK